MTDKVQILAYLAQVQGMQIAAKHVTLVIEYGPQECYFRVQLYDQRGERYAFCIAHSLPEEENKSENQRLTNVYNHYEHDSNNNRTLKP